MNDEIVNCKHLDAITVSSIVLGIINGSKDELLACISLMDHGNLQNLFLGFLRQIDHSFAKDLIDANWKSQGHKDGKCVYKIKHHFVSRSPANNEINCKFINMMPSSIGSYICSYGSMKEVLKYSTVCRAFYKYCQVPMAKQHLVIDHSFARALYNKTVDFTKYFNIKSLSVRYAFCDSFNKHHSYIGFEDTYFSAIAQIVDKSPELHTLCYNLRFKRFKQDLDETSSGNRSAGVIGHIFKWFAGVQLYNMYSKWGQPVFKSVKKFIYTPCQPFITNRWEWQHMWSEHPHFWQVSMPNLESIVIPNTKLYAQNVFLWAPPAGYRFGDRDLEWKIFQFQYFVDRITEMNVNMVPKYTRTHTRHYTLTHVHINYNPLIHFGWFVHLESLILKMPIFEQCVDYYSVLWNVIHFPVACSNLKTLKLEFIWSDVHNFQGRPNHNIQNNYPQVIDSICECVLSQSPNVTHLELNTNRLANKDTGQRFSCLMAHYGKLETLVTDSLSMCTDSNTRFLSLRKLSVSVVDGIDMNNIDFTLFPNLESLKWICSYNRVSGKKMDLNKNIASFLEYISLNKHIASRLTSISLSHAPIITNKHEAKWYRFSNVKKSSAEICKLITSLTTNHGIQSIELGSVSFDAKAIEYLSFWFHAPFGLFRVEPFTKRTKYCICLINQQ